MTGFDYPIAVEQTTNYKGATQSKPDDVNKIYAELADRKRQLESFET